LSLKNLSHTQATEILRKIPWKPGMRHEERTEEKRNYKEKKSR
jgi:hypothetical protein